MKPSHLSFLTTNKSWNDLAPDKKTMKQLKEIMNWLKHSSDIKALAVGKKKIKHGYRCLFDGPAGTGKTLAATLLGNECNMEVYKIDLSMVVSKYIGETEKNLAKLFDEAEYKNWILFFDEADALFGKRTNVRDAHDKYANQEVSYLLQRLENYPGLVILATNMKRNMDKAFIRRFQSVIHFSSPGPVPS